MLITRKIGKVILGGATPAQLMIASVLGGMLGFMPGLWQAAGAIALLTVLLVLLNANLVLAGVTGLVAKAVSIPLLPVTFMVGRALLDGPLQPVFRWAINAPVLALFGFEYYATTGGLLLGALFGAIVGLIVVKAVRLLRQRMAAIEEGSEKYQKWASKWWVKTFRWIIFGKAPKGGYKAALEARGKVIRPLGVVAAAGLVVVVVLINLLLADEIVTVALQRGLERANGATVDLERAEVNLRQGRLSATGLAIADPNALERNLFEARELTGELSVADLLRKRITLDQIVFNDAATGAERPFPGRLVRDRRAPSPAPETEPDEKTIEDYFEDWERLKDRLAQVRDWLERIAGPESAPEEVRPPLRDRLEQRIAESGYALVAATHLVDRAPTLTVHYLEAERVRAVQLDGETIDIHGHTLSTHPHLLEEAPRLRIASSDSDKLLVDLDLAGATRTPGESTMQFHYKRLPVERVTQGLGFAGESPIREGTLDLQMAGALGAAPEPSVDLPLNVTLRDSTVRIGDRDQRIDELPVTLGLRGPVDNPAIALDHERLAGALVEAGATQAARDALREHAGVDLDEVDLDELDLGDVDLGEADVPDVDVGGLLGRGRDDDDADDADDQDDADDEDQEEADDDDPADRARDLFEGLRR